MILNAPASYRFTAPGCPESHWKVSEMPGAKVNGSRLEDAGKILAGRIVELLQELGVPNGLRTLCYGSADIPALVEDTLPQHRVTKLSPCPADPDDLAQIFAESIVAW